MENILDQLRKSLDDLDEVIDILDGLVDPDNLVPFQKEKLRSVSGFIKKELNKREREMLFRFEEAHTGQGDRP